MSHNGIYKNEPRPRLCHLRRWPDFVGYGFNLHSERSKPGQYIGKVDPNSPAESAGLKENDRIVEVNFVPIGSENHKQVVARIKEGVSRSGTKHTEEVILLVLDEDADEYYKSKNYVVRSTDANVEKLEADARDGSVESGSDSPQSYNRSTSKNGAYYNTEAPPQTKSKNDYRRDSNSPGPIASTHNKNKTSPAISRTSDQGSEPSEEQETYHRTSLPGSDKNQHREYPSANTYTNVNSSPRTSVQDYRPKLSGNISSQSSSSANGSGGALLDTQMSVAEYRAKIQANNPKKQDPRQTQRMSMKQKHDYIDQL